MANFSVTTFSHLLAITIACLGFLRSQKGATFGPLILSLGACQLSLLALPVFGADVKTKTEDTSEGAKKEVSEGEKSIDDAGEESTADEKDMEKSYEQSWDWDSGDFYDMSDEDILKDTPKFDEKEFTDRLSNTGNDQLFSRIEEVHLASGKTSFGDFLDAGTGGHSLQYIASVLHRESLLPPVGADGEAGFCSAEHPSACLRNITMDQYTAVTASGPMHKATLRRAAQFDVVGGGKIVVGNWQDPKFLEGKRFDTILADYLIGAIEGFAPYFQDLILHRLVEHLKPGGRLYVVGLTPVPDEIKGPGDVFCRITKARDACILLAGDRCYREYPESWVHRHMRSAGLEIVDSLIYPIRQTHNTMVRQINVARDKLEFFPTDDLAEEMGVVLDELEEEAIEVTNKFGPIEVGSDYVISAELPLDWDEEEE